MIVKILHNATTMSAVDYNEKKIKNNLGDFICAENFKGLESIQILNSDIYKKYLTEWSNRNSRIKKAQFHVAISSKGKEYGAFELKKIAKEWLKLMGYEKQPYLLYFHRDTLNNHVHIVTSRIDEKGKKINDSHERRRAVEVMNKIMKRDITKIGRDKFVNALSYNFSSINQFIAILESSNMKLIKDGEIFSVIMEGKKIIQNKKMEIINWAIDRNVKKYINNERVRQIRALFYKYKDKLNLDDFTNLMKKKFGIEIKLFGIKGKEYGYIVIDNKEKKVYKGGEIIPLKILKDNNNISDVNSKVRELLLQYNLTTKELNIRLRKNKVFIKEGNIIAKISGEKIGVLDNEIKEILNLNNKLSFANNFNVDNKNKRNIIADILGINSEIVKVNDEKNYNETIIEYYRNILEMGNYCTFRDAGITFRKNENGVYLIDWKNRNIIDLSEEGLEFKNGIEYNINENEAYNDKIGERDLERVLSVFSLGNFNNNYISDISDDEEYKKRKKKR